MTNASAERRQPLDWLRVGAWSGSFAAHVGILLLIALPMTVPPLRHIDPTIVARWIETPPPRPIFDEPPPPVVPHHLHATPPARTPPPVPVTSSPIETPTAPVQDDPAPAATLATSPVPAPSAGGDIGSGGATQALAYAAPVQPRYPPAAVHAREQGTVVLRVLVDASGAPQRVEIARSSGHADLDAAARESVARARFRPVMRNGEAIQAWGLVPIEFRLDRG